MTTPTTDPNHPWNRYPWQSANSRERKGIDDFLDVAEAFAGEAPLPAAEARRMLDWLRELVKRPSPLSP
jgi:hypothetical protein